MSDIHIYIEREQPVKVITLEPSGKRGPAGPNSVTSATTSDGTCDLELNTLVVGGETLNTEITSNGTLRIENSTTGALSLMTSAAAAFTTSTGSSLIGVSSISISSIVDEETTSTAFMLPDRIQVQSDAGYISLLNTGNADFSGDVTVEGTLTADHIHGNLAGSVYAHVRAGETLAKGDPVYISGSHGSGENLIPIVSKADASNAAKMPAVGIMDAALTIHNNGHMVIIGTITQLNTNAYAVNSVLYVASGGGFTATPPAANSQAVAIVERSNTNNGAVIVKVNGLASNGGNGVSDANKLVRFGSAGTIPVASIGGLGTGVATALAVNTGSAGAFVVNGGTATDMTLAGSAAFTSTTRPTSAGTGTPEATSLITRADGDTRYSDTSTNYITTNQTRADNALFTGASTLITIPRLTVGYLPSRIIVRGVIMFTTAPLAFAPANFEFLLYDTRIGTANMSTGTPLTIAPTSVTKVSSLEQYIFYAEVSAAAISAKYGADFSAYGLLGFLNGCDLRNKTGGSLTTVTTNAGYISIEIYR